MEVPLLLFNQVQKLRFHRDARGHVVTQEVLRDITLAFARGEVTAVLGPPGAGKTALLRLACRLEEPNGGSILFRGRDLRTFPPRTLRRRVGLVWPEPLLFGESVEDNVCFGLLQQGLTREEARAAAREALEETGLDHSFLDRRNGSLTPTQAVWAALARTLVLRPEALLLDEPARGQAPALREEILTLCRRKAREQRLAVVVASRDRDPARFAARVVVLADGAVVAEEAATRFDPDRIPLAAPEARTPDEEGAP